MLTEVRRLMAEEKQRQVHAQEQAQGDGEQLEPRAPGVPIATASQAQPTPAKKSKSWAVGVYSQFKRKEQPTGMRHEANTAIDFYYVTGRS